MLATRRRFLVGSGLLAASAALEEIEKAYADYRAGVLDKG